MDKRKFLTLKEINGGTMKFGDNAMTRIIGKDTLSLDNGKTRTENVLYVKGLKHNLLRVCQLCDQGHSLTFHPSGCEIRKTRIGKLVGDASRTTNNLYNFSEVKGEKSYMAQEDESWLCVIITLKFYLFIYLLLL